MATTRQTQIADQEKNTKMQFEAALLFLLLRWGRTVRSAIAKGNLFINSFQLPLSQLLETQYNKVSLRFRNIIIRQLKTGQIPIEPLNEMLGNFSMNRALVASSFIIATLQKRLGVIQQTTDDLKTLSQLWYTAALSHFRGVVVTTETQTIAENTKAMSTFYFSTVTGTMLSNSWVTVGDERVREWHQEANGQQQDVGHPFTVGPDQLLFPGDPRGSLPNIMGCRCALVLVVERSKKTLTSYLLLYERFLFQIQNF